MAKTEKKVIAPITDGYDTTRGWIKSDDEIFSSDDILENNRQDYSIYDDVLKDTQVQTAWTQRTSALIARQYSVQPGGTKRADKACAEQLKDVLDSIGVPKMESTYAQASGAQGFDSATELMHYGMLTGKSVAELMWGKDGRFFTINQILVRDHRRFTFNADKELLLKTDRGDYPGKPLPAHKFWYFHSGGMHSDDPYGIGLWSYLYWPVYWKNRAAEWLDIYLNRFAMPAIGIRYPEHWDSECSTPDKRAEYEALKKQYVAAAQEFRSSAVIAYSELAPIELIEAARQSSAEYEAVIRNIWDKHIARVIVGQDSTIEGAPGNLGKEETRENVFEAIVTKAANAINFSFNVQVAFYLRNRNYPNAALPILVRQVEEQEDLNQRASRDSTIMAITGKSFKPEYIAKVYGPDYEDAFADDEPDAVAEVEANPDTDSQQEQAGFSDADLVSHAEVPQPDDIADKMYDAISPAWKEMVQTIRTFISDSIKSGMSLTDIQDGLDELFTELDREELQAMIAAGLTNAFLSGYTTNED